MAWQDFIASDPLVLGGKPVVRGTRLSVDFLLGLFAAGWTQEEVLASYRPLPSNPCAPSSPTQRRPSMTNESSRSSPMRLDEVSRRREHSARSATENDVDSREDEIELRLRKLPHPFR